MHFPLRIGIYKGIDPFFGSKPKPKRKNF